MNKKRENGDFLKKETKDKLISAFIELSQHKQLDDMSISELTALAKINRGTFYLTYEDFNGFILSLEKDLLIGFEVSKRFIRNEFVKDKASFRPDLILHQSQLDFNVNYQKIFVEIKTTFSLNRRKIKPDLNKIIFAIKQYSFENGVFIAINTNEERLLKLIKQLIAEYNLLYPDIINWDKFFLFYGNVEGVKWHKSFSEIYHS